MNPEIFIIYLLDYFSTCLLACYGKRTAHSLRPTLIVIYSACRYSPFLFEKIFIQENELDPRQLHPKLRMIVGMLFCVSSLFPLSFGVNISIFIGIIGNFWRFYMFENDRYFRRFNGQR